MYRRIEQCLKENNLLPIKGRILGVSSIDNLRGMIRTDDITIAQYPEVDMQQLPYENETFDAVMSDQVIEHVQNVTQATEESLRVLKKNGLAIHTTCFMSHIQPNPKEYWRFSPDALKYLFRNSAEILQCETWGNRIAILLCLIGDGFRLMQIPDNPFDFRHWIATRNEERYPIVTWIVARK
jgi:SAM-dependent methyltransferase